MREAPIDITTYEIAKALESCFGIVTTELTFLPLGDDSASSAFRAETVMGTSYFVKLRSHQGFRIASLAVPHLLQTECVSHVLTPMATVKHELWVNLDRYALTVYPFIESRPAYEVGLSELQWFSLGKTVRHIHHVNHKNIPDMLTEVFVPSRNDLVPVIEAILRQITEPAATKPAYEIDHPTKEQRNLAIFWQAHRDVIAQLVRRTNNLARALRTARDMPADFLPDANRPVLCHADLHTWNIVVDHAGEMWIVDWDETIMAPKERDLMFFIRGIGRNLVTPRETECFLQGYGDCEIDQTALSYYRHAWAIQDLAAYAERVALLPELSTSAQVDALNSIISMFEPDNIVDIALSSQE